mmetsp:Transcript_22015/g.42231  ORF Transcript_22015/g.42231 Transcript_22015/m.42231 type:complete len:363 (+) Transcript_22015:218-1306(+)
MNSGFRRPGAKGFTTGETAGEREPLLQYHTSAKTRIFQEKSKKNGSTRRFLKYFFSLWLMPWLNFTLTSLSFMSVGGEAPTVVTIFTGVQVAVFISLSIYLFIKQQPRQDYNGVPHSYRKVMYAVNAFAIILGALIGDGLYEIYMTDYLDYEVRRHYTNVSPDESAAAHADASVIVFAEGARPDTNKFIGYDTDGSTYCVAPITDVDAEASSEETTTEIQYWAAGKDCCKDKYTCDDVGILDAHSGLVLHKRTSNLEFLRGSLIEDMEDNFKEATKTAMAKYDLVSSDKALMVTFVKDITAARNKLYWRAWRTWMIWKAIGIGLFLVFAILTLMTDDEECLPDIKQMKSDSLAMFATGVSPA